ncbi:hypothetical protein IMSAG049_01559 [Clostridiales bacterium]|nr:hypothetical protein IMSAG049_01559 [Clostridiales bacterium]
MITREYEKTYEITEISEAVRLHYFDEEKFNTNFISVIWTIPAEKKNVTKVSLLAECLRLGIDGNRHALEEKLSEMYGAVFDAVVLQKGGRQLLALNIECIKDSVAGEKVLKNAAGLINDIINSKIADNALTQAKRRLKTRLVTKNDLAAEYAIEKLIDITYPNDSFSVHCDGYIDDIDKIDTKELNELFNELKCSAHTDIFISGELTKEKAMSISKSLIGRRENIKKLPIDEINICFGCAATSEKRLISQSRLAVAYTSKLNPWGKDWCIGLVLREILCGAGSSVLYDSVRQEEGLCYYIGGRLMRFRMVYVIDAGVDSGNEDKTLKLIDEAINSCCIDEDKLDAAKKAVLKDLKATEDRRTGIINEKLNEMLLGITIEHQAEKDIQTITIKDVMSALKGLEKKGVFIVASDK